MIDKGVASTLPVAVETSDPHGQFRIVDLEPGSYRIAALKTDARKSLKNVLDNKKADKVFDLMNAVTKKDEE